MPNGTEDRDRHSDTGTSPIELVRGFVRTTLDDALETLVKRAREGEDEGEVERAFGRVREVRRLRRAIDTLAKGPTPAREPAVPVYLVSAAFLAHSFSLLTQTRDEHLVYATGPEDGKELFALTRLVEFDLAEKSPGRAVPDPRSQIVALSKLDQCEERLLATFHSHPAGVTEPSDTDLSTQKRLEEMRYPAIGAVFSRDGFIRFYSVDRPFRVVVSGAGCKKVEERLFRLDAAGPKSLFRKVVDRVSRS